MYCTKTRQRRSAARHGYWPHFPALVTKVWVAPGARLAEQLQRLALRARRAVAERGGQQAQAARGAERVQAAAVVPHQARQRQQRLGPGAREARRADPCRGLTPLIEAKHRARQTPGTLLVKQGHACRFWTVLRHPRETDDCASCPHKVPLYQQCMGAFTGGRWRTAATHGPGQMQAMLRGRLDTP